jgi:hypothetical protein
MHVAEGLSAILRKLGDILVGGLLGRRFLGGGRLGHLIGGESGAAQNSRRNKGCGQRLTVSHDDSNLYLTDLESCCFERVRSISVQSSDEGAVAWTGD